MEGDLDPVEYYGSEELVEHIWSNLLSNAIRFTPDGGQITVVLRNRDSWRGMPPSAPGAPSERGDDVT